MRSYGLSRLMQRYGFSSSAVREALSRLVTDGLVEAVDQRGFRTTPASREQLIDITETRVTVESVALQRSIEHGDLAWESRIVAAFHRLAVVRVTRLTYLSANEEHCGSRMMTFTPH